MPIKKRIKIIYFFILIGALLLPFQNCSRINNFEVNSQNLNSDAGDVDQVNFIYPKINDPDLVDEAEAPNMSPLIVEECDVPRNAGDPKLTITPQNELILFSSTASLGGGKKRPLIWKLSDEASDWVKGNPLLFQHSQQDWLWGMTWLQDYVYAVTYRPDNGKYRPFLHFSDSQIQSFKPINPISSVGTETALVGIDDDKILAMIRTSSQVVNPQYELVLLDKFGNKIKSRLYSNGGIGGQSLIQIDVEGKKYILASYRFFAYNQNDLYEQKIQVSLIDVQSLEIAELITIADNGVDMGYTGMSYVDKKLFISYYNADLARDEFIKNPTKDIPASIYVGILSLSIKDNKIETSIIANNKIIPSSGRHLAFTSMAYWNSKFYVVYREAMDHYVLTTADSSSSYEDFLQKSCAVPGGIFKIINSQDGIHWDSHSTVRADNVGSLEEEAPEIYLATSLL